MITHKYYQYPTGAKAYADTVHYEAEQVKRQEVTAEWYMTTGLDNDMQLWAYIEGQSEFGLDPWRMIDGPEDKPNARYFVQKNQLARISAPC